MVRISAGDLKGRSLVVPDSIRPTGARLREALFDLWVDKVRGALVLDLFAGSGAVGLEALSRGASRLVSVESDRQVLQALRGNMARFASGKVQIVVGKLPEYLPRLEPMAGEGFGLVFADPPYDFTEFEELLTGLVPLLSPTGEIAIEHDSGSELPDQIAGLTTGDRRRYGDSGLSCYRRDEDL